MQNKQSFVLSLPFSLVSVLISGICFYFGFSLNGNMGWLMWIAPIPILYISLFVKPARAFNFAFIAYLIGRISWLPYLLSVMPVALAILFTFILPLIFALIVIAARKIVLISQHWSSALAFPILFTAFEYLLFILSRDGTAASIAYTQSNCLPIIQIASITGILGISFLLCYVPSSIALVCYFRKNRKTALILLGLFIIVTADALIYGLIRLKKLETGESIQLGLAVIDEKAYKGVYEHDPAKEMQLTDLYLQEASRLADQGAQVILLPEKAIVVNDSTISSILQRFTQLAVNRHVQLIIGGTKLKSGYYLNNAWVISSQGKMLADYQKVNLFEGEVLDGCKPGNQIAIFSPGTIHEGVAICKDMDFQQFILGYSKQRPAVLFVPAWDFITDGWMHARMAIMRSVEGGFSLVRNARQGRLTISDWRGKVLFEASSESGIPIFLLGKLSIEPHPTTYARAGDWFGTVSMFAALGLLIYLATNRKRKNKHSIHI
jgi:apolipoprotein N-acyltransferase